MKVGGEVKGELRSTREADCSGPDKRVTGGGVSGREEKEREKWRRGTLTHSLELFKTEFGHRQTR